MVIFLTGGTGFIGSHFINQAHKAGHEILALRRPGSRPKVKLTKEPTWIEGSLDTDLSVILSKCQVFVHLAAFGVSPQPSNWHDCFYWNLTKSLKLLKQALDSGIERVISVGTFAEYGEAGLDYEFIPPECLLRPIGAYATSKAAFSIAMTSMCQEYNAFSTYYRLFSVFGDGQYEGNLYPSLKKAAFSNKDFSMTKGEQIRDFISVENATRQIVCGLKFEDTVVGRSATLNIGSGKPQTILEFSRHHWEKWNAKGILKIGELPYRDNETMRYVAKI